MATDFGVRQGLISKGIDSQDIGYDPNSGYVQVKGQNFLKPEMNVQGTTYTTQDNFNNAYNQYLRNQNQQSQQDLTNSYINRVQNPNINNPYADQTQQLTNQYIQQNANPQPRVNPYADQFNSLIGQIQQKLSQPAPDVYSSPQYAAAQAQQQYAAKQGIRASQEALGAAGFGRSTTLGDEANRIQNQANQYLQTQLVPQIANQLFQQRQQELGNYYNLLNPLMSEAQRQDQLQQQQHENLANTVNFLAGRQDQSTNQYRLQNQDIGNIINLLNAQNQQSLENQRAESGLTGMYDGQRTLAGQQADLQAQQALGALTGKLSDGSPTYAAQQQQIQNALARANAFGVVDNQADANLLGVPVGTTTRALQAMMNDMAYKNANLGLRAQSNAIAAERAGNQAGVNAARSDYYKSQANKNNTPKPATQNEKESAYMQNLEQMSPENRQKLFKDEKANIINDLGISGYNQLYNMYYDQYGNPK